MIIKIWDFLSFLIYFNVSYSLFLSNCHQVSICTRLTFSHNWRNQGFSYNGQPFFQKYQDTCETCISYVEDNIGKAALRYYANRSSLWMEIIHTWASNSISKYLFLRKSRCVLRFSSKNGHCSTVNNSKKWDTKHPSIKYW